MRQGLLGPFQAGALSAMAEMMKAAEGFSGQRGCDIEGLFYATAFQAGIERFVIHEGEGTQLPHSEFLETRLTTLNRVRSEKNWSNVRTAFSRHLPDNWWRDDKYSHLWAWNAFVADLYDAMDTGASLMSVGGVPDTSDIEQLAPPELLLPLRNLSLAFQQTSAPCTVPCTVIARDYVERYRTILESDLFRSYVHSEKQFEDVAVPVATALDQVLATAQSLVRNNPTLLAVRRGSVAVLGFTPKLIDSVFGKLPGAIAEVGAKLGSSYLDEKRRIVVYDFRGIVFGNLLENLVRMIRADNAAKGIDQK
jgi:hypothetical protein